MITMKHTPTFARLSTLFAAAALAAHAAPASAQAEVFGQASSTVSNISYRLIDLAPDDGIAPAITWEKGTWALTSSRPTSIKTTADGVRYLSYGGSGDALVGEQLGDPFTPSDVFSAVSADGNTVYTGSGSTYTVSTVLKQADVASMDASWSNPVKYDAAGQPIPGQYHEATEMRGISAGRTSASFEGYQQPGADSYNPNGIWMTLTPHTLLVVQGTTESSTSLDASFVEQLKASETAPYSQNLGASAGVNVNMSGYSLNEDPQLVPLGEFTSSASIGTTVRLERAIDTGEIKVFYADARGTSSEMFNSTPGTPLEQGPYAVNRVHDWSVQYMNVEDNAAMVSLYVDVFAQVDYDATDLVSIVIPAPPVIEAPAFDPSLVDPMTASVPEPGTWALMGLGLVGLALVRRRA